MEPKIITKERFTVLGLEVCINIHRADFDDIWKNQYTARQKDIPASSPGTYGVYWRQGQDGKVGYIAGAQVPDHTPAPEGLTLLELKEAQYAVFECTTDTIGRTWGFIHGEWFPKSEQYRLAGKPVFEYYPPGYGESTSQIFIHVPLAPK